MCGIAGFIDFKGNSSKELLIKMTDSLSHRGPDDAGYECWQTDNYHIGLGHRRLSIIDLSPLGHQPMHFEHLSIVFNGEIYNFKEIRQELIDAGYQFISESDTEVILKGYQHWGAKVVDKCLGMFAFVLFDRKVNKIILFRDRAGVKPMYYTFQHGVFLFGSELKALYVHPTFQKKLNMGAVSQFLHYGYVLAPHTIFEKVYKLKQGHYLTLDLDTQQTTETRYWDVSTFYNLPKLNISFEDAKEELERLLISAFDYRMVADVPIGVFLSGGYDSSAVTALLQKDRTEKLKTFTIGFNEAKYDESGYAKQVAQHLGTDHHEYICTFDEAKAIIPQIPYFYDEPFADASAIPTTLVSQLARKEVTVALSADAGDEIFAGYHKYLYCLKIKGYADKIPAIVKKGIGGTMQIINPEALNKFLKIPRFEHRYHKLQGMMSVIDPVMFMKEISATFDDRAIQSLLLNPVNEAHSYWTPDSPLLNGGNDSLSAMLRTDYQTYMVDDILTKVDRATMSVSLEGREPLLDHRIVEFAATLPSQYKYDGISTKKILREITHQYIPKKIMDRPKMGFGIPVAQWLKTEFRGYVETYLGEDYLQKQGIFNARYVSAMKDSFLREDKVTPEKIWFLLMFQLWYEKWMK